MVTITLDPMSPRGNQNPEVRSGRHVIYNLSAHMDFIAKNRREAFMDEPARCEETMRKACEDEPKQFNGEEDHMHLPVHYPPKVQLSKLVNSLKGTSSRCTCARNSTRTSAGTYGAATSGPGRTSPEAAAGHR
ncbi:IS200/IS605 family transposase [Streptomyces sp. NBC_01446]|uniref:IS200/IS605 family transposase n=1 Tax=Streptomyces sp. NBC_00119 TaxID=2975659 RepID=A0AAU1U1A5_9ACTN|nr:IS200/IS605 family transposase [Streptomyces sp. NBC_01446]